MNTNKDNIQDSIEEYKKYQTIKIWKKTLRRLRMIYALSGESMVSILDKLVTVELEHKMERQLRTKEEN